MIHLITAYHLINLIILDHLIKSTKRRDFGERNLLKLKEALGDVGWSSVIDEMDPDQSLDNFYNILTEKLDKFCPYRNLKGKRTHQENQG